MFEQIILVGRLGQDAELKFLANGRAMCSFTLATNERRRDLTTGEWSDLTKWWRVTVFGKFAEVCGERLSKGDTVQVIGRIRPPRLYTAADGTTKVAGLELMADRVVFVSTAKRAKASAESEEHKEFPV